MSTNLTENNLETVIFIGDISKRVKLVAGLIWLSIKDKSGYTQLLFVAFWQ